MQEENMPRNGTVAVAVSQRRELARTSGRDGDSAVIPTTITADIALMSRNVSLTCSIRHARVLLSLQPSSTLVRALLRGFERECGQVVLSLSLSLSSLEYVKSKAEAYSVASFHVHLQY